MRQVMPYLSRRAIENKSVLFDGAGAAERQTAGREIWKRVFG
jgi:proline dehydrogenase